MGALGADLKGVTEKTELIILLEQSFGLFCSFVSCKMFMPLLNTAASSRCVLRLQQPPEGVPPFEL